MNLLAPRTHGPASAVNPCRLPGQRASVRHGFHAAAIPTADLDLWRGAFQKATVSGRRANLAGKL